jgi:dihydrofolate reductase
MVLDGIIIYRGIYQDDMKFFKNITTNTINPFDKNAVIMGSQTWHSIPNKFLINRINIIITNKLDEKDNEQDLYFVNSLDNALEKAKLLKAKKYLL